MVKIAFVFGVLLILLGVGTYFVAETENRSPTALIPSVAGVLIAICGFVAANPNARKHAMHAAAMIGTLGFLAGVGGIVRVLAKTGTLPDGLKMVGMGGMALLCAVFVGLCVKSFVDVRRARQGETQGFPRA